MKINPVRERMKVVITGGMGFLGQRLAEEILEQRHLGLPDGTFIDDPEIVLADLPGAVPNDAVAGRVVTRALDIRDAGAVRRLIDADTAAVFHLAAVVSRAAETDFDRGMQVNMDGARNVLEAARAQARFLPLVSTSTLAVFGGALPSRLTDAQAVQPGNSYGAGKAVGELLCADYRRKGFCDARILRLPTIVIRPGAFDAAASSFASAILREPLNGRSAVCPVPRELPLWIASPEAAVRGMLHAMTVDGARWPEFGALNLPGLSTSVDEMLATLEDYAGSGAADLVRFEPDPEIEAIVGAWPQDFDTSTADALGFAVDSSLDALIDSHVERYMGGAPHESLTGTPLQIRRANAYPFG